MVEWSNAESRSSFSCTRIGLPGALGRLRDEYGRVLIMAKRSLVPLDPLNRRQHTADSLRPPGIPPKGQGGRDQQRTAGVELRDFFRSGRVFFLVEATFLTFQYEQICIFRMESSQPVLRKYGLKCPLQLVALSSCCLFVCLWLSTYLVLEIHKHRRGKLDRIIFGNWSAKLNGHLKAHLLWPQPIQMFSRLVSQPTML